MSCCGSKRQQAAHAATTIPAAPRATATAVLFVYDGLAPLTLTGSATGRHYHFPERGARLAVDARDVPAMQTVPGLRRLTV